MEKALNPALVFILFYTYIITKRGRAPYTLLNEWCLWSDR